MLRHFGIVVKKQSNLLDHGQALYSLRHSGAIGLFKRTGL